MTKIAYLFICLILFCAILIGGCVNSRNAIVTTDIVVNHSGYITEYETTISLPRSNYHDLCNHIASQKYSSVREYFLRDYGFSHEYFDTKEDIKDQAIITFKNVVPISSDNTPKPISVKIINNDQVFFNDSSFSSDYFIPKKFIKELKYSVTLPVIIDKGNYQKLSKDGYTAYWTYKNDANTWFANNPIDIPTLYVISQVANENNVKPTESPGFGVIASIICLLISLFVIRGIND